jgi:hypothetical protein
MGRTLKESFKIYSLDRYIVARAAIKDMKYQQLLFNKISPKKFGGIFCPFGGFS